MAHTMGGRIRQLRMMAGWDAKELAAKALIGPSALSKMENGSQTPTQVQFNTISEALAEAPIFKLWGIDGPALRAVLWGDKALALHVEEWPTISVPPRGHDQGSRENNNHHRLTELLRFPTFSPARSLVSVLL